MINTSVAVMGALILLVGSLSPASAQVDQPLSPNLRLNMTIEPQSVAPWVEDRSIVATRLVWDMPDAFNDRFRNFWIAYRFDGALSPAYARWSRSHNLFVGGSISFGKDLEIGGQVGVARTVYLQTRLDAIKIDHLDTSLSLRAYPFGNAVALRAGYDLSLQRGSVSGWKPNHRAVFHLVVPLGGR